jgi:hypothetical protein
MIDQRKVLTVSYQMMYNLRNGLMISTKQQLNLAKTIVQLLEQLLASKSIEEEDKTSKKVLWMLRII